MRSALLHVSVAHPVVPRPVFPGDHPDPTVIAVGDEYWASSTSGEWSPQFPLFHSRDLMNWTPAGSIFPVQPRWAEGSFWAPELVEDRGRFFVYYVARKRGSVLSIAVATAPSPRGPWKDHGPLVSEPLGSIDPAFARDEHGKPFLIWKTDGNSQKQPTPIWAQPLTPDLLHLTGTPTQLITNDSPWEGGLVEGPYILRHAHRFYLFYAGNECCGRECKYAEGVARADHLLGPWTKFPRNPLINGNDHWRCPGHGTGVRGHAKHGKKGQDYLLYHSYGTAGGIFVGRQAVLDKIEWGADGWPSVNAGMGPRAETPMELIDPIDLHDDFRSKKLGPSWQWPVNTIPIITTGQGTLQLTVPDDRQSSMIALPMPGSPRYVASVVLCAHGTPPPRDEPLQPPATNRDPSWERDPAPYPEAVPVQPETPTYNPPPATLWAGLTLVGDPFNTIGLGLRDGRLELWERRGASEQVLWAQALAPDIGHVHLRVASVDGAQLQFSFSFDGQREWHEAGEQVDASPLPAWDHGLRIALMLEGPAQSTATFEDFDLISR